MLAAVASDFRKSRQKIAAAGGKRNASRAPVVPPVPAAAASSGTTDDQPAPASPPTKAKRVGVKLEKGWHKRNYLTEVLLPSLIVRREGVPNAAPVFPPLAAGQIGITWVGHASFFVQIAGLNILIDPNWSLWLKGVKRLRKPGLRLDALPMIDLVLVTHAHFDHLDRRTLKAVAANQPIVVPFGVGNLVHDLGFERVHELDYWGTCAFGGGLSVTLTPCQHWGARLLHDQHRGFGGFVLSAGEGACSTAETRRISTVSARSAGVSRWRSPCCPSGPTRRPANATPT